MVIDQGTGRTIGQFIGGFAGAVEVPHQSICLILGLAATGLIFVVETQINTGVDARNRRALDQLTTAWDKIEELRDSNVSSDKSQFFRAETVLSLNSTLQKLNLDAKRDSESPLFDCTRSFIRPNRLWEIANARKALVQATLAMKSAIKDSAEETIDSPSATVFQKHIETSREILDGRFRLHTDRASYKVAWEAARSAPDRMTLAFLTVDGLLLISGLV